MIPEQEIRLEALKIKIAHVTALKSACVIANRDSNTDIWNDGDLEEFVEYITSGKKGGE